MLIAAGVGDTGFPVGFSPPRSTSVATFLAATVYRSSPQTALAFPMVPACSTGSLSRGGRYGLEPGQFPSVSRMRSCLLRMHTAEQGRRLFEGYGLVPA